MFYISAKKSVVDKDEEEDDLPDSYDYKDSFIVCREKVAS
jgi:hypothetical protein